ncbi:MAG: dienelactone hydrolase family protein [Actinomycetota bacterium]|nr:MAG: dienelactone hydrolase family protein [Actinomycetota bacterium]
MALSDYLRGEILEEAELGYISREERDRQLAALETSELAGDTGSGEVAAMVERSSSGENQNSIADDYHDISVARVTAKSSESDVLAYLSKPREGRGLPGIVVIHENKGLTPHIEDVTRRFAREGFAAIAPDLLSRRGGTSNFASPSDATSALRSIRGNELDEDLMAVVSLLAGDASVQQERIGVVGFCFGGGMAWRLATRDPRIRAAVPFYGVNPNLKYVPNIQAKVLAIYGELDQRINAGINEISEAMEFNKKTFEKVIYAGAQHGFHNDTNPDRYHPVAAREAWLRTLEWLRVWLADD